MYPSGCPSLPTHSKQDFSVDFSFAKRVVSSVRLYIDGTFVDGLYCNYPKPAKYPSHSIKNVQTSATTTKSLQFSNVELTSQFRDPCSRHNVQVGVDFCSLRITMCYRG